MPSGFSKEWVHSSYGFPGSIFNQLRNNNANLNQENNFETTNNNNQETQNIENSTTTTNTGQERHRQVINEPISLVNNQFSSIDEQNKISSSKYPDSTNDDNNPSNLSSLNNINNNNNNSNLITTTNTRENEGNILKSAQSTNSIDSNHAVVDEPLFMEGKSKTAEHYNAINDHDYGNLLPTKEKKINTTTTTTSTTHDDNQNDFGNLLPMGHNREEESKVLPMNKNIMPGTFTSPIAPPLPTTTTTTTATSSSNENKNEIDDEIENMNINENEIKNENELKKNNDDDDDDQIDTSFIDFSTEPVIASIIAGSAIPTDKILTKGNDVTDSSTTEKNKDIITNQIKDNNNNNDDDDNQKNIEQHNVNENNENADSLHPLTPNDHSEITTSSSDPSSTIDPFHFENNNNNLNNNRHRRKSLSADQCAAALPVLGSYVPFAQGVAITFNSRERYNQESQRRASTDRRYSLNHDMIDDHHQKQQHQSSETTDNSTTRRKNSLTAGIEKLLHLRKKSN